MKPVWMPAAAAALAMALSANASAEEMTAWRLFIADHEAARVTVLDAIAGEPVKTFEVESPAALYRSESGRVVFARQGEAGLVTAISSGISFDDHGDHGDIDVEAPKLTGTEVAGDKPSHIVEHDGVFAAFFDGEGVARIISEKAVLEGGSEFREVKTDAPHHGVAVAYGSHVLLSEPNRENPDELPVGIRVVDEAGAQVGDVHACPDLHGEASSGNILAFACATGLLVVTHEGGMPQIRHLPYADSLPDGESTTLAGGRGLQYFLGNYGADKVVLIDPMESDAIRLIELPTRRVHFAVDPIRARFAYVFTEDGQLHQVDVIKGGIANSLGLTGPYSMDGHWSDPRPRIAVADDNIYVTDPLNGVVHSVAAASFQKAGEIAVEGKPYDIVAVGGSGEAHEGEEAHDNHDHAHDHDADQIYKGYFEDDQIRERALSDWEGDWQSVYPYLQDGTLDPVMEHKAQTGDKTAEEYEAYYEVGYKTDVERIVIDGDTVTFFKNGQPLKARYASDGYEILTYEKGNRGVRFIFEKTEGDGAAPRYIQFSDHKIAPADADHYHLYWGDDRAALLEEVTNWPTYYPSSLSAEDIVDEMMAH